MATTPTRMANGIRQNAQSAFNLNNGGTAGPDNIQRGNLVQGRINPKANITSITGFGIKGNKGFGGYMNRVLSDITDTVDVQGPVSPVKPFQGAGSPVVKDDTPRRMMTAMLPGVDRSGTLSVTKIAKPTVAPKAETSAGGPMQDIYSQALTELGNIIRNPDLARREITTSLGNKYSVIDRPKMQALQSIIESAGEQFKTEQAGALGAANLGLEAERNRIAGLGIEEKARARLSTDIARNESQGIEQENLFQDRLKLFSPQTGAGAVNARAGLFRMALAGEKIHPAYKSQADKLVTDFNEKYKRYLQSNELEDTPENEETFLREFESSLV